MFYRIIREFNDGRLYYLGGAAGDGTSWTAAAENARHYRSADQSVRIGAKVGKPGGLSFPMFCKMFGWADPKYAMVYCNPSADDMADLL